jgi:hypothetical protein
LSFWEKLLLKAKRLIRHRALTLSGYTFLSLLCWYLCKEGLRYILKGIFKLELPVYRKNTKHCQKQFFILPL